jgi:hypothetical protein
MIAFEFLSYMSYIYTRKHHKYDCFGRLVLGRAQSGGVSPRTVQLGGATSDGKIPFPLMTMEDRFMRYKDK